MRDPCRTKAVLNARDYGVTCSGTIDNTAAMQSAIDAACNTGGLGKTLILPNSCTVKLTSTLNVTKCSGTSWMAARLKDRRLSARQDERDRGRGPSMVWSDRGNGFRNQPNS